MDKFWLYQQLFHEPGENETTTDDLLLRYVDSTAEAMMAQGWIDQFFFLRYSEEGYHIRYRIRLTEIVDQCAVNRYLQDAAARLEMVVRIKSAVYEPETEKYGGPAGMDIAERQFCASSRLALSCINRTRGRLNLRFMVAANAFDMLLTVGNIRGLARAVLLQGYARYWHDFCCRISGTILPRPDPHPQLVSWMEEFLASQDDALNILGDLAGPGLVTWLATLKSDMAELDKLSREGRLTTSRKHILCNFAHTLNNRLGLGPFDEVLIADLLVVSGARRDSQLQNVRDSSFPEEGNDDG